MKRWSGNSVLGALNQHHVGQAPLTDLYSTDELCGRNPLVSVELAHKLSEASKLWHSAGGERALGTADLSCFLPMPRLGSWSWQVSKQASLTVCS